MALKAIEETLEHVPEQFHELYTERNGKFEFTGVEGVKTQADIDRIQAGLTKERTDHKKTKEKFAPLADRDINEVISALDRIPELEAAAEGKLDDTKIEAIVERRIKSKVAPIERERDLLKGQLAEKDTVITGFISKERNRAIKDTVREAAAKAKMLPEAQEDAFLLAERVFEVDEDGAVLTKDGVGCTPGIDPVTWLTEMQSKRPHWWGESVGGGGRGNRGRVAAGDNPFTAEGWNMTAQGKLVQEDRAKAEAMAKSAGTTIGGRKPEPRAKAR